MLLKVLSYLLLSLLAYLQEDDIVKVDSSWYSNPMKRDQPRLEAKEGSPPPTQAGPLDEARSLLAELFGTFALTFVAAGAIVIAQVSGGEVSYVARVLAPGLTVMAMIYTLGDISGAHVNPAVTLAFALRGAFNWYRVPGYWLAQLAGALFAAEVLRLLFGEAGRLGATLPRYGDIPAFVMEVILTTFLVSVIIGTATDSKVVGPNAGIAVGATIAFCGLFADPISGASMNPARSLGPAVISGNISAAWIYIVAPLTGSLLAVLIAWLLKGQPTEHEEEAASGSPPGAAS